MTTTEKTPMLGEIVIRYDNERPRVGTARAFSKIEKFTVDEASDCDEKGWHVIVHVATPQAAAAIRKIVLAAPADMYIDSDTTASSYRPVTARQLENAGVVVTGGLGDADDLDTAGNWRISILLHSLESLRLEVLESRGFGPAEWHDALPPVGRSGDQSQERADRRNSYANLWELFRSLQS